ncbi:MAG: HD domain-containing protein [bacterium]
MKKNLERLTKFFYEVGTLRKLARSHRQTLLTDDLSDNIASHSYRVTVISYFLAVEEKVDPNKVIKMALFHDVSEARSGDQNWVHKKYVKVYEEEIMKDQLDGIVNDNEIFTVMEEYNKRESKESKIAKDADLLDQIYLLKEYEHRGNVEAKRWLKSNAQYKSIYSKTAKKIAELAMKSEPNVWWWNVWTDKRRK